MIFWFVFVTVIVVVVSAHSGRRSQVDITAFRSQKTAGKDPLLDGTEEIDHAFLVDC